MAPAPDRGPLIGDVSEGDLLRAILARTPESAFAELGPGDDAAVVRAPSGSVVVTTDTLVHGPDFRLAWSSGYDLGWKAAAVNLADVAAMGARPTGLLVALAIPRDMPVAFVEQLADGLREGCEALAPGSAVVGGDLTASDVLTIAVTALGDLEGRPAVTRSGARVGDTVALAGVLGRASHGLAVLFDRFRDAAGTPVPVDETVLTPEEADALVVQLRPSPPIGLGPVAAMAGATAMMDVSDGLALDAGRMAKASAVTIALNSAELTRAAARSSGAGSVDFDRVMGGGEDHGLLATFPPGMLPEGFTPIGAVVAAVPDAPVTLDGAPAPASGWDPYRDWDAAVG